MAITPIPGTNQFLPWNSSQTNQTSQTNYATEVGSGGTLQNGYAVNGQPTSQDYNKMFSQALNATAAIMSFIASQGQSPTDNGNITNLTSAITAALAVFIANSTDIQASDGGTENAIQLTIPADVLPNLPSTDQLSGLSFRFFKNGTCITGNVSLTVNGTPCTLYTDQRLTSSGVSAGDLQDGECYTLLFSGSGRAFLAKEKQTASGFSSLTTTSITVSTGLSNLDSQNISVVQYGTIPSAFSIAVSGNSFTIYGTNATTYIWTASNIY